MLSDEQLMLQFQTGSAQAFDELFERYRNPIYGFFRRRLTSAARAEEMAQETFVVILRGAERYESRARFQTYIYAIALRLLFTERRTERRERARSLETQDTDDFPRRSDPSSAIWIREALARLDPDQREVLMLREYEQLPYEDIADLLRIPVNTVRSRLSRARLALKSLLAPQNERAAQSQRIEEAGR